jgi:biotin carboxyl carrier protein
MRASRTVWIELDGTTHEVVVSGEPDGSVTVDGTGLQVDARELAPGVLSLLLTLADGRRQSFRCVDDPAAGDAAVVIDGERFGYAVSDPRSLRSASGAAAGIAGPRALKSPMPGRILRVLVAAGEMVEAGQGCVVIEAMKMQNELKAPRAGRVTALSVRVGETVAAGAVLLMVE